MAQITKLVLCQLSFLPKMKINADLKSCTGWLKTFGSPFFLGQRTSFCFVSLRSTSAALAGANGNNLFVAALVFLATLLCGCSPLFIVRATYEESKILLSRKKIADVISDPTTTEVEKEKLQLVLNARGFGESIGLNPEGSFTQYSKVDKDELAWVLVASRPDSFELFTWWFPVVGSIPYKAYFEKADAERAGKTLESLGYETWIRPTDAFSTLGWFDDPILSTTLKNDEIQLTNTVLHESLHGSVWADGFVDFNESLANFVGHAANIDFYKHQSGLCGDSSCRDLNAKRLSISSQSFDGALRTSDIIVGLFDDLSALYSSSRSKEEKIAERAIIFERHISPLRAKNPNMKSFVKINNAEIMQHKLYFTGLRSFERLFSSCSREWTCFLAKIKQTAETKDKSPWELLNLGSNNEIR